MCSQICLNDWDNFGSETVTDSRFEMKQTVRQVGVLTVGAHSAECRQQSVCADVQGNQTCQALLLWVGGETSVTALRLRAAILLLS